MKRLESEKARKLIHKEKFDISSPSSMTRKVRRFLFGLAIFHKISGNATIVDIAELKSHLDYEIERLGKTLGLVNEGLYSFPVMKKDFHMHMEEEFSPERSVLCCHLRYSSPMMEKLFHTYEEVGTASLSKQGFLKAVEECNRNIANRANISILANSNIILEELRLFASEDMQFKEANGGSQKNAFNLGLGDSAMADGSPGGLSSLGERRRSSRMSSLADDDLSRSDEPPTIHLRCDEHGVERFYLSDLMCLKCEEECQGFVSGGGIEKKSLSFAKKTSHKRKTSFSFH